MKNTCILYIHYPSSTPHIHHSSSTTNTPHLDVHHLSSTHSHQLPSSQLPLLHPHTCMSLTPAPPIHTPLSQFHHYSSIHSHHTHMFITAAPFTILTNTTNVHQLLPLKRFVNQLPPNDTITVHQLLPQTQSLSITSTHWHRKCQSAPPTDTITVYQLLP